MRFMREREREREREGGREKERERGREREGRVGKKNSLQKRRTLVPLIIVVEVSCRCTHDSLKSLSTTDWLEELVKESL